MNKDKALESVNEIKELMEKSSKFISVSGLAAILAGIYASYYTGHVFNRCPGINGYNSPVGTGSRSRYCRHPVLLQIQEDRTEVFQPAHLSGIMEFFASDADRRHCVYFYPDARVL